MAEQVLVFPADVLPADYYPKGVLVDQAAVATTFSDIMNSGRLHYTNRDAAETDESVKQLIPYLVLYSEDQDGTYVAAYKRTKKGGEGRLHDKWSIGVGGHINPCDGPGTGIEFYESGVRRELLEEVGLNIGYVPPPVALLYDDSNEVGRVHFGVVHFIKVAESDLKVADPALTSIHWCGRGALLNVRDKMENWSKLLVDNLRLPV